MFMDSLRRAKNKHRGILILIVVLLSISVVASFAVMGSSSLFRNSGSNDANSPEQLQLQAEAILSAIEEAEAATGERDFTANSNLAGLYASLTGVYQQLGDEQFKTAAASAAQYYQACLDTAPAELNATGKANILVQKAASLYLTGDLEGARADYQQALEIDPENWNSIYGYSMFLMDTEGMAASEAYLNELLQTTLDPNSETGKQVVQLLEVFKAMQEAPPEGTDPNGTGDEGENVTPPDGPTGNAPLDDAENGGGEGE